MSEGFAKLVHDTHVYMHVKKSWSRGLHVMDVQKGLCLLSFLGNTQKMRGCSCSCIFVCGDGCVRRGTHA